MSTGKPTTAHHAITSKKGTPVLTRTFGWRLATQDSLSKTTGNNRDEKSMEADPGTSNSVSQRVTEAPYRHKSSDLKLVLKFIISILVILIILALALLIYRFRKSLRKFWSTRIRPFLRRFCCIWRVQQSHSHTFLLEGKYSCNLLAMGWAK